MPLFYNKPPPFRPQKELTFEWDSFDGGLNTLFRDTEIKKNEVSQFQNLMLTGQGVPTKRWGTSLYFRSSTSGAVRGMSGFYQKDGTNELLAITDDGYLNKRNSSSFTQIAGVSWASGYDVGMAQIADKMYFVGGDRELARYDGTTLTGFATIDQPSSVGVSQLSGASGANTYSYRLTHTTEVGETTPSTAVTLANQPEDTSDGTIRLAWTNASSASGIRKGTNIYKGELGYETFVAKVDGESTFWLDDGTAVPTLFNFPPTVDTTGGADAKYIIRFQDRLVISGIANDPTLVLISGREPLQERFDFSSNGGFVRVEPDSGDDIVGLDVKGERIIVFKERSIWQIKLEQRGYKTVNEITLTALDPQVELITASLGCASHKTIAHVENDILFLANGKKGVYVLGNEPGIIGDILRTNEVSVKIRPFFESLTAAQEQDACAVYYNNKYFLGVPTKGQTMVLDRERNAWMGPWTFDARLFHIYYDSSDQSQLLKGNDDGPDVEGVSQSYIDDRGTAFNTIMRTKREDFGDWTRFKNVKRIFTLWRNLSGTVDVDIRLEERSGNTITAKDFSVTTAAGNSGWGADLWADTQFGDTEEQGEARDLSEVIKYANLFRGARNVQLIVKTDESDDNYELMSINGEANRLGETRRSAWKV
jgi:hypothetical protein